MIVKLIKITYSICPNYNILNPKFHPSYLFNFSGCFMLSVIFFKKNFNEVLISLHNCLDSIHTNCPVATCGIFNFLYKDIADSIIFIIHVLRLSIFYVDVSFFI
jgi:hypothetical protein